MNKDKIDYFSFQCWDLEDFNYKKFAKMLIYECAKLSQFAVMEDSLDKNKINAENVNKKFEEANKIREYILRNMGVEITEMSINVKEILGG